MGYVSFREGTFEDIFIGNLQNPAKIEALHKDGDKLSLQSFFLTHVLRFIVGFYL